MSDLIVGIQYLWWFVNAVTGFPNWNELWKKLGEIFLLHYDVLFWSVGTFYSPLSGDSTSVYPLPLCSRDIINTKYSNLFLAGSEIEAFANQTMEATAVTDMAWYRIHSNDIYALAET